jgi:hypothetical protein
MLGLLQSVLVSAPPAALLRHGATATCPDYEVISGWPPHGRQAYAGLARTHARRSARTNPEIKRAERQAECYCSGREWIWAPMVLRCASATLGLFARTSRQMPWVDRLGLLPPDRATHLANAIGADLVGMPVAAGDQMEHTQDARHSIQRFSRHADSSGPTPYCGARESTCHPWTVDPTWANNHGSTAMHVGQTPHGG